MKGIIHDGIGIAVSDSTYEALRKDIQWMITQQDPQLRLMGLDDVWPPVFPFPNSLFCLFRLLCDKAEVIGDD